MLFWICSQEGGPAAVANFEAGVQGFTTRAFRGCGVVTSEPFEVSDEMEAVQMLQRFTQVGEFYVMSKPEGIKKDAKGFMDILIYDEEADRHVKITYRQALLATGIMKPNLSAIKADADLGATAAALDLVGGQTITQWATAAALLLTANEVGATTDNVKPVADGGLADCPVVISRPFIEHAMLSAVLAVSGSDTGATIFGPSDMQISANTSVKTIEGHYTGHFKSVITKHQNVFVMKDIMANGYRAGANTKFFVPLATKGGLTATKLSDGADAMMKRLNMDDATGDETLGSMLAFPMSAAQFDSGNMDIAMSVTSRFLPYEVAAREHKSFPGGEKMYQFYSTALNLRAVHFGEDLRASENMEYMSQGSTNNSLCFLGPHRKFDPIEEKYITMIPGMGHWGPDARAGDVSHCRAFRTRAALPARCLARSPRAPPPSPPCTGSLAPRRVGQHDLRARVHDDV